MVETNPMLYHVGCGAPLFRLNQTSDGGMALACGVCGASAPIVTPDLNSEETDAPALPASLLWITKDTKDKPHLEYYLGFTDFDCPAKRAWERRLREEWGLISFSECPDERCQKEPERARRRLHMLQEEDD